MAAEDIGLDIALEYRREGELSTGRLFALRGGNEFHSEDFEKASFPKLLAQLARMIARYPGARVVLIRTDQPNLFPYVLDQETVDLFVVDPVAAIRSMTYEVQEVPVPKKEDKTPVEVRPLRVGYETLASAFGENVYVRVRNRSIECPGCGLWGEVKGHEFTCTRRCAGTLTVPVTLSKYWAAISVEDLLESHLVKFFIPRIWNDGRSWVTREDLQEKYTAYKAEKEEACSLKESTRA